MVEYPRVDTLLLTIQASKDRGHTAMDRSPITHDVSLKAHLGLEDTILSLAVLAGVRVVESIID